jgi:hypothetical protein
MCNNKITQRQCQVTPSLLSSSLGDVCHSPSVAILAQVAQVQTLLHRRVAVAFANFVAMMRQALSMAARRAAVGQRLALQRPGVVRSFGAVAKKEETTAVARPFRGASRAEPDMEYIEEPSMLYMTCLVASPWVFSFWFLTKFV